MSKLINLSNLKKVTLLTTAMVVVAFSGASIYYVISNNISKASADISDCTNHIGNHYDYKAPTYTTSGNKEFWVCCNCHEVYLEKPSTGTWTDQGQIKDYLPNDHKAYLAPLEYVNKITVTGDEYVKDNATANYTVDISPTTASNKNVTWSTENGTGSGTISEDGLFTPSSLGTVTIKATAQDGSGVVGTKTINVVDHNPHVIFSQGVYSGGGPSGIITWLGKIGNETVITVVQSKGNGVNEVNSSYIEFPRIYAKHILTFTISEGYYLTDIRGTTNETGGSKGYAQAWTNSTWSSGTASNEGSSIYWSGSVGEELTMSEGAQIRLINGFSFTVIKAND